MIAHVPHLAVPLAQQSSSDDLNLLWVYIGIGAVVAIILLAAVVATPSSRRREDGNRKGPGNSSRSRKAEAEGFSRQGADTNRWA